jgi:hypothetical protein
MKNSSDARFRWEVNDEMEILSHEDLKKKLSNGYMFSPDTPGLQEAARDVLRPIIEKMDGQEIVYETCTVRLVHVSFLEVNDEKFRAVATHVRWVKWGIWHEPGGNPPEPEKPFEFWGHWLFFHITRSGGIKGYMSGEVFYPDPALVGLIKAAADRGAQPKEIAALLRPA